VETFAGGYKPTLIPARRKSESVTKKKEDPYYLQHYEPWFIECMIEVIICDLRDGFNMRDAPEEYLRERAMRALSSDPTKTLGDRGMETMSRNAVYRVLDVLRKGNLLKEGV
jgi:hypothetical protein